MTAPALDCALWLAARGLYVFPVDSPALPQCAGLHRGGCDGKRGKHPATKWGRTATIDHATITRAFSRAPRNIGIACGPSGLLVIDEDEPDALYRYAATVGATVEPTFGVTTARGCHWYFQRPGGEPLGNSPGALADFHIDVRGAGGFVVGPGSVHESGHEYRPIDTAVPIAPVPTWILDAIRARSDQSQPRHQAGQGHAVPTPEVRLAVDSGVSPAWIEAAFHGQVDKLTSHPGAMQGRNDLLNSVAYRLGRIVGAGALRRDDVEDALLHATRHWWGVAPAGDGKGHPFTPGEAKSTINSGLTAGERSPHPLTSTTPRRRVA